MKLKEIKLLGVVAASGAITAGALSIAVAGGHATTSIAAPAFQAGSTTTMGKATGAPAVASAAPSIKGPAPLPAEEQGLPG